MHSDLNNYSNYCSVAYIPIVRAVEAGICMAEMAQCSEGRSLHTASA